MLKDTWPQICQIKPHSKLPATCIYGTLVKSRVNNTLGYYLLLVKCVTLYALSLAPLCCYSSLPFSN